MIWAAFLLQANGETNAGAWALCIALVIGLLFYVFYLPPEVAAAPKKTRLTFLKERKEVIYENLRDLNFEFKAGKIAEADFEEMRTSLEAEATELLAEIETLEKAPTKSRNGFTLKNATKGARP